MDISTHKLKNIAGKVLKPAREEAKEISDVAKSQVTGTDKGSAQQDQPSPIVEAMQQTSASDPNDPQVKGKKRKFISDQQRIEDEIRRARQHREELAKIAAESRDPEEETVESKPGEPMQAVPMPKSKPSRGTAFSPERRKSRH